MGDTKVGTRRIIIAQMRVTFLEYPPMLADEVLHMDRYAKRVGDNPEKTDVIYGDDVKQFRVDSNGSAWNDPDETKAATLFDTVAAGKSLGLRLETGRTVSRLLEAQKNKSVLAFVELAILEAKQAYIDGDHGLQTSPYTDARNLDSVRLNSCIVKSTGTSSDYALEVHFKAKSSQSRSRGGGGSCPPWACGSNHNENFVLDIEE